MSFFQLPTELQTYIYEFDTTYHRKLNKVKDEISFLNSHRYFYYDKNRNLSCFYIVPKNIDIFFIYILSFLNFLTSDFDSKSITNLGSLFSEKTV